MTELVHLSVSDGIATVTLDSPRNRNALSRQLVHELHDRLQSGMADQDVRAIVLTGTGPVFCAGADLKERRLDNDDQSGHSFADVLSLIMTGPTPVIVKMNGPARAGGLGLVAAADIAIAPAGATFAFSEVRIGVVPAMIAVPCSRRMTPRAISRYFLTGETFDAATALDVGLVSIVSDDVDSACEELVAAFRLGAPGALRAAKGLTDEAQKGDVPSALKAMEEVSARLFSGPEAQEGMAAFIEKRAPAWARGV